MRMKRYLLGAAIFICGLAVYWLTGSLDASTYKKTTVWIFTYHSVSDDETLWNNYTISPQEFESDLRYMSEHNFHAVTVEDLIAHVGEGKALPENPIVISFDDGYRNIYTEVFPLLKKYKTRIVLSLIGEFIDAAENGGAERTILTWQEAKEMADSGWVELANHSWGLHHDAERSGSSRKKKEPLADYQTVLRNDIGFMQESVAKHTGHIPLTFVYPYGAVSKESAPVLKKLGINVTFTIMRGSNTIKPNGNLNQLFRLLRNNRPHGVSSAEFFQNYLPM